MHARTAAYNQSLQPSDRQLCELLAREIELALPGSENRVWHDHPVWFLDGNPVVGYSRLKGSVSLLFWSGQSFRSGGLEPEGKFKAAAVRFTDAGQVDLQALRNWLAEAREVQWDYRNLVRRKGRLERLR